MDEMQVNLFGNYKTEKFTDIYTNFEDFLKDYGDNGIKKTISEDSLKTLYYLLYSKYGNSHICNYDINQFKYRLFSTIFQFGPTWEKRLEIQDKLRNLTDEELLSGSKQINNHAYNPSTEPSTTDTTELPFVNEQATTKFKKGKLDGYAILTSLLETDVTEEFLNKFKKLFLLVIEPQLPLWYVTEEGV